MKKVAILFVMSVGLFSCSSLNSVNKSGVTTAASLLSTLTPNSSVGQIASLFSLLDTNSDKAISTVEAIGSVAENFNVLDSNKNSLLSLTELEGLLPLLK